MRSPLPLRRLAIFLVALASLVASPPALAQGQSAEALAKDAIAKAQTDYAAGQYDRAIARIDKALRACGDSACKADARAMLHLDKGVMLARKGQAAAAEDAFRDALQISPTLTLPRGYDVPQVRGAYTKGKADAQNGQPSEGDFTHKPWSEQRAGTPLPVYVEYDGPLGKVVVRYRAPGDDEWKRITLRRMGSGWAGVLPCDAVEEEGVLRYYVQGLDEDDLPVASSGSKEHPFKVSLKEELEGVAPHLPGRHAPRACVDGGCNKEPAACGLGKAAEAEAAETAAPVEIGPSGDFARVWVGVAGAGGFEIHGGAQDVCFLTPTGQTLNAKYYCTNPDGSDFPSRASSAELKSLSIGRAGSVDAGVSPSAIRVMFALDFAATQNFLIGARLGYVMNTYTGDAAKNDGKILPIPLHAEARATYLFGKAPLATEGFAPLMMLAAGTTRIDGESTVVVTRAGIAGQRPAQAWSLAGPLMVGAGAGLRYAFSQRVGFSLIGRFDMAFLGGGIGTAADIEATIQYGF